MPEKGRQSHASQGGFILPAVLVLLALGVLLLIPTTQLAWASLNANQVTEWKADELYDADSGVEEAVRWILFDGQTGNGWTEIVPGSWKRNSLDHSLNGSQVDVGIETLSANLFRVTSTATREGSDTTIVAYVTVEISDFSFLLDNAITSGGNVKVTGPCEVLGDILYSPAGENGPPEYYPPYEEPDYWEVTQEELEWPPADFLSAWYLDQYDPAVPPYDYDEAHTVSLVGSTELNPVQLGPIACASDLTIQGPGWLELTGTVYVGGVFDVKSPSPGVNMVLGSQTIFANHNGIIENDLSINIPTGTTLRESGCIIGRNNVYCAPQCEVGEEETQFVLLMSCHGWVDLNPLGEFNGSIVGNANVDLSNGTIVWVDPEGKGINFPMGDGNIGEPGIVLAVPSYVIS